VAGSTIAIYDSLYEIYVPTSSIQIVEDSANSIPFNQVNHSSFSRFIPFNQFKFNEYKNSYYWLRFKVINHSSEDHRWMLQAPLHSEYIELYFESDSNKVAHFLTGQNFNFLSRDYEVRSIAFALPFLRNKEYWVYLKVHNTTHTHLHFIITDQKPYTRVLVGGYLFLGIVYGILLLMALYNLILFLSIKSKVYIFYVLYIIASGIFISWKDGLAFQYIWPEHPWVNGFHHKVSLYLLVITFALYAFSFLKIKKHSLKIYRLIFVSLIINTGLFIYRFFKPDYFDAFPIDYLATYSLIFGFAFYMWLKDVRIARYFLLGSFLMLAALIILKLRYHQLMEWSVFVEYSLNYAVMVEAVTMSLALRDRIVQLRKQKEEAQEKLIDEMKEREAAQIKLIFQLEDNERLKDKVNKELEQKVIERTNQLNDKVKELNEAKEKLADSYKKLNEASSKLDLDNWNLKKDIKTERKLRISSEIVPFEKFLEVFPEETACLRMLNQKKWGEDGSLYECKKCGNKKFLEVQSLKFAKKCTKCNYIETVSANTLFHGVKFELNKAFYIVYIATQAPEIPVVKLSEQIQLRKNTCGKFYNKVEERMELFKKKNNQKTISAWENLLLE
jgi:predicted nucleic-acid-binding Zn-ribbon protein